MPNFSFKGRNRSGEIISGERVADNRQALALALRRDQIALMDAEEKKAKKGFNMEFGGAPTPKDVAVFTRQFSVMIDSGVPLVQCLEILGDTQENKKFAAAVKAVHGRHDFEGAPAVELTPLAHELDGALVGLRSRRAEKDLPEAALA